MAPRGDSKGIHEAMQLASNAAEEARAPPVQNSSHPRDDQRPPDRRWTTCKSISRQPLGDCSANDARTADDQRQLRPVMRRARRVKSGAAAEYCAAKHRRRAGIRLDNRGPSSRRQRRDRPWVAILVKHASVSIDLEPAEREDIRRDDGPCAERRLIDRPRPVRLGGSSPFVASPSASSGLKDHPRMPNCNASNGGLQAAQQEPVRLHRELIDRVRLERLLVGAATFAASLGTSSMPSVDDQPCQIHRAAR